MKEKPFPADMALSTSEVTNKGDLKGISDEEEREINETESSLEANSESSSQPVEYKQNSEDVTIEESGLEARESETVKSEAEKLITEAADDVSPEIPAEGDDGWQPVQRPKSAGSSGRRLRQRRPTKVLGYSRKDDVSEAEQTRLKNNFQSSRYYLIKRRATSPGRYADYYVAKTPPGNKYGRRVVRSVTYRVKSVSSSSKDATTGNGGESSPSPLENDPVSAPAPAEVGHISRKSSIVNLGRSPSYKEVALAPPGSISSLQARVFQNESPDTDEAQENGDKHNEAQKYPDSIEVDEGRRKIENTKDTEVDLAYSLKEDSVATDMKEEALPSGLVDNKESEAESADMKTNQSSVVDVDQMEQESSQTCSQPHFVDSAQVSLQGADDQSEQQPAVSCSGDTRDLSNKKLSASAAPFNPSPAVARIAPLPMNITLPSGPGTVCHWPMNVALHPGSATVLPSPICSSPHPHHPYPSPPPTPNMMHPLPFMYPPYTQAPSLPPTSFPVTSGPFHPGHFAWQRSMSPNASDYIHGTVWPGLHPVEFTVSQPVVEPITDLAGEPKKEPDHFEGLSLEANLQVDLNSGDEGKKEARLPASEAVETFSEIPVVHPDKERVTVASNLSSIPFPGNQPNSIHDPNGDSMKHGQQGSQRHQPKDDNEKTFNILIKGRRNRKQTLRMPISLLKKPYSSQSFKVVYSRVIKETEGPKSVRFTSDDTATENAT